MADSACQLNMPVCVTVTTKIWRLEPKCHRISCRIFFHYYQVKSRREIG